MIARLSLPARFSFDAVVRSHGWYDLPPFSYEREAGVLTTFVDVTTGKAAEVTFRVRNGKLEARGDLDSRALRAMARRVFSLDLDFSGAQQSLSSAPELARALDRRGGRMLRTPTLFEDAVKMLFTTNCSWAATRGMVERLIALAGVGRRAFPSAESVAKLSTVTLATRVRCGYRAKALHLFAKRVASGQLDLAAWEDPNFSSQELREAIVAERGFGPYAAEGLMRILGRHDFFALDSWTRQQYRKLYPGPASSTDGAIARRYSRFGAHRGLALWLDMTSGWHPEEGPKTHDPGPK
ncbi:MAG TPA: Fe-S cluster assembly protein HesB [Thermoanaerobaculia bacterium]